MLLFLMIPLALLALTIAVAPILAMSVLHHREVRPGRRPSADTVASPPATPPATPPSDRPATPPTTPPSDRPADGFREHVRSA